MSSLDKFVVYEVCNRALWDKRNELYSAGRYGHIKAMMTETAAIEFAKTQAHNYMQQGLIVVRSTIIPVVELDLTLTSDIRRL